MNKFRLNSGQDVRPDTSKPKLATGKYPTKTYKAGDVVVSDQDLVALHGPQRYTRLTYDTAQPVGCPTPQAPAVPPPQAEVQTLAERYPDLDSMTAEQLKQVASDEELEIPHGTRSKQDLLKFLKAS